MFKRVLLGCSIVLLAVSAAALDFDNGFYGSLSDYLDEIYGVDANAGLTTFPVLNVPMGGRAEGMATAFAAVADDVSFLEYNPAGSSMLPRSELAFFHNNWIGDTKVEAAAFASRKNNFGFGAGLKWLYTPFTEYDMTGERASKGYYSEAVAILNASYNFFSGYYFGGLSLGMNLKTAFRIVPDYSDDEGNIISGSGLSQSGVGVMGDLGLLTRFNLFKFYSARDHNTSLALVMRNLGPPVKNEALPTAATAAFSYRPWRPFLIAFDFSLPVNTMELAASEKPYWALGLSADITRFLSMRTGILMKPGNFRLTLGSAITLQRVALEINYSLDLTTQFRPMNRISIGVRFDLGDQGRLANSQRVDELYLLGLNAYSVGNNREARHYWEEALKINPRFDPAKEGLRTIEETESLDERIDEMQNIESFLQR
jgi:tetratricopeptide (TPR) repeat protein